ncbi:MAG: 30S ribosome-binding factor RbfA [Bacteriovoracia bacterium]
MQPTRKSRLESVILEEISTLVARELRDPRIPLLTFTKAVVSDDASIATLYFTILGAALDTPTEEAAALAHAREREEELQDCLDGLTSAAGFLRRHLARALNIRHIPQLVFKQDKGLDNSLRVHELLNQLSQAPKK